MIVECESCHTRFRLAEERIPATGAKVRCSRCKTAFIVQRPGVSRDEVIDEVVAEASSPGSLRAPEPSRDAFEMTGSATMTLGGSLEPARSDEEKWEFNEEPRSGNPSPGAKAPSAGSRKPAESPDSDDLDSLGSPEDWDLLGNGARRIAAEARFDAPTAPPLPQQAAPTPTEERVSAPSRSVESALAAAVAEPAPTVETPGWTQSLRNLAQSGVDGGVWLAAVAICAAGLALALSPQSEASASHANAPTAVFEAKPLEVSMHAVESGIGGTLWVVRGQLPLRAATNQPLRLRVAWLDAQGALIAGASAIAGPPLAQSKLRESSLERLRAEHAAHALGIAAGGAFEAVFDPLPTGAVSLSLMREREPKTKKPLSKVCKRKAASSLWRATG